MDLMRLDEENIKEILSKISASTLVSYPMYILKWKLKPYFELIHNLIGFEVIRVLPRHD